MINRLIILIIVGALWSIAANAHHNTASHYVMDQTITVEGVVTEFRLINPHVRFYFDVTTEDGDVEQWLAEGGAGVILVRTGWTEDTLKSGDVVKVTGRPGRDGSNIIAWQLIEVSDGRILGGQSGSPEELRRRAEELDRRRRAQ